MFVATLRNRNSIHVSLMLILVTLSACSGEQAATRTSDTTPVTTTAVAPVITSNGTDFYLTLPDHICASDPASCGSATVNNKLIIAASSATTGNVTFNGATTPFTVSAGANIEIALDPAVVLTKNETIETKAIHVTATLPVSVHIVSENATSADGYLALPTEGLGTNYRIMSYASSRYQGSEFAIVGTQNTTTVTITPTASGASKTAGNAFNVTLNSGETYLYQNPGNADLTGSLISADKPVAVFSGHRCADVPSNTGYCDYLVEQIPDISVWGNTFHASPFSGRARYTLRILSGMDGTIISSTPANLVTGTLNAGQYIDLQLSGNAEFSSNNPVLVAQYINGYDDDSAKEGDPSMILITPAEMGMTETTFGVHSLTGSNGTLMNVTTETASLPNLKLDNTTVNASLFTQIGATGKYSKGTLPVTAGAHSLAGSAPFSAMIYDYGITWNAVSYAYPVSTMLSFPNNAAASAPAATSGNECSEEANRHNDYRHHHRRKHRHHYHHHYGEYCLIHHTAHRHEGKDHEYECDE